MSPKHSVILFRSNLKKALKFHFTVSQGPLITRCPGNIFLPSNQASLIFENFARVEWTEPISDGIADTGNPIVSETFFEIGNPSNVMYFFTNEAGTSVCSFTVLVSQSKLKKRYRYHHWDIFPSTKILQSTR